VSKNAIPSKDKYRIRPYLKLHTFWQTDAKVRKARAVVVWPLVLTLLKQNNGFCSDDDLDPDVMAETLQVVSAEDIARAISGLKSVGLLVFGSATKHVNQHKSVEMSGWCTPKWDQYQADARDDWAKAAHTDAHRGEARQGDGERTPASAGESLHVQTCAEKEKETEKETERETERETDLAAVAAVAHTSTRDGAAPPAATPTPPPERGDLDLQSTIEAYRCGMAPTRGGGRAQFLPSGLLAQVMKLHADFGGPMVRQAIEEAIGAKNEIPGPSYLRAICQRMRDKPGERRPGADPGVFRAKGPVAPFIEGNPDEAFGPRLPDDHEDGSHAL
jgi:hypothetical protein